LRVPAIVDLADRACAGLSDDTPSSFADWLPTLCAAAGIPTPLDLDGGNLLPAWTGTGEPARRRPIFWVDARNGGQAAVRFGSFKVLRQGLHTAAPSAWEIYDLDRDPGETRNLAAARRDLIERAQLVLRAELARRPVPAMAHNH
jgi:arylsulfatase A-like enzyme